MTRYLENLNERQKEAVAHKDGPLLIIAGAGAGKTKTLTHRILALIESGVTPGNILAITFTNKAAKEMEARIGALLGNDRRFNFPVSSPERPFVSTFHALGAYLLRWESEAIGLPRHFSIFDDQESLGFVKEALETLSLDPKQWEPRRMLSAISREKGEMKTAEEYVAGVGNEYFPRVLAQVWRAYEAILGKHKGVDFDDLLLKTFLLLRENDEVRKRCHERWRYIHIDEYQDTNIVQYELSRLLAGEMQNICVVGDMDQSIYSWRGADFRNILNFERDFPRACIVTLEENYRSTGNILAAANEIIRKNELRKEKNLFTKKAGGEKISLCGAYDENEEALFVTRKTRELIEAGVSPNDVAVLYRANFQSRVLEEAFLAADIPYQILGVKFFERKEVKDVLAYLRAALNPENLADIKRIVNVPPRGVGKVTLAKIFSGTAAALPPKMKEKVMAFHALLERVRARALEHPVAETLAYVIRESGIEQMLKKGAAEEQERLENVKELVTLAKKWDAYPPEEGVAALLDQAALVSDQDSLLNAREEKKENAVRLMTVHASKGLEFPYVFVVGLEEGLFPHAGLGAEKTQAEEEEERRLFYVALTRAEKKVFLSYASVRTIYGAKEINMPSRFITDISDTLLEADAAPERVIAID